MEITISKLTVHELDAVDTLMKRNSKTLGFIPQAVLNDYLKKGGVFGAKTNANPQNFSGYLILPQRRSQSFIEKIW